MKITEVRLYSSNNTLVSTFSFRDPGSQNPYIAKEILGLDAEEIVPRFYGISQVSKSRYYAMSLNSRQIVINVSLNPEFAVNQTYSDLRDNLYRAISASRTGEMMIKFFNGDEEVADIGAFLVKMESPHFTDTPEVHITLVCDDPMLHAPMPVVFTSGINPRSIPEDVSTAPHGFSFKVKFTALTNSFYIRDAATPEWAFTVTPGTIGGATGFRVDDELYFSSEQPKQIYLVRAG